MFVFLVPARPGRVVLRRLKDLLALGRLQFGTERIPGGSEDAVVSKSLGTVLLSLTQMYV